jgi:photosystem II stability/assembly factor-like uncharacterized protein
MRIPFTNKSQQKTGLGNAFCLFLFLPFLYCGSLQAQTWIPLGPFSMPKPANSVDRSLSQANGVGRAGAVVTKPGSSGDELFLLTPFDRYRSSVDGGGTWTRPRISGLPASGISDLVFLGCGSMMAVTGDADCILNPNGPALNSEYCQSRGVFATKDGGKNWYGPVGRWYDSSHQPIDDFWKYPSLKVCRKLIRVAGSRKVLLGVIHTCEPVRKQFDGTVYRTTDGGRNWYPVLEVSDGFFKDIIAAPKDRNKLFVAGRTVYRSLDAGKTWQSLQSTGLPPDSLVSRCELAVTPAAPDLLYILVTLKIGRSNELYLFDDTKGISRKIAGGITSPEWRSALAVDRNDPDMVYFTAGNKVNRMERTDSVWRPVFAGVGLHDDVHELTPAAGGGMYVSTDGGPALTTDQGKTWKLLYDGLDIAQCWGVAVHATGDTVTLLAGLQDCGTIKSTFKLENISGGSAATSLIGFSPNWEIIRGGDGMKPLIIGPEGATCISTDGNNNLNFRWEASSGQWRMMNLPSGRQAEYQRPFIADPSDTSTFYTGYDDVFRSTDGGDSWKPLGIPLTGISDRRISAIAVAPADPKVLYVAFSQPAWKESVSGKIFRSTDGGNSWNDISAGLRGAAWNSITSIAVDPLRPEHVVVGFRGGWNIKVMESFSGGAASSWTDVSAGLPVSGDVNTLVFHPSEADRLFAATHEGIWERNSTEEWKDFNGNRPPVFTSDLSIDSAGSFLVAGTHGAGVWLTLLKPAVR